MARKMRDESQDLAIERERNQPGEITKLFLNTTDVARGPLKTKAQQSQSESKVSEN